MRKLLLVSVLAACGTDPAPGEPSGPLPDDADPPAELDGAITLPFEYPRGCYSGTAATDPTVSPSLLGNPGLVGLAVTIEWRELEAAGDNQFAWDVMDARVADVTAAGKKVVLSIVASAAKPPAWLIADPAVTKIEIVDPNSNHGTGTITVVPFWDPTFHAQKLELIRKAGQHFASNPNVIGVMTAFANYYTNDWGIPPDMLDAGGYSYQRMIQIGKDVLTTTAMAFPHQAIKLPLGRNDPTTDPDKTTTQMSDDIVAFAQGSAFAGRFFAQKNLIKADSPPATDPHLGEDPNTNDYLLKVLRDMSPHAGLQMLASATGAEGDDCRQNGHVHPCPPHEVLDASISVSLTYQPTYLEFWTADGANPDLYDLIANATTSMQEQP